MLHPTGRLIAFAILHQSYSSEPANPYVPLLLNVSNKLFSSFFCILDHHEMEGFPIPPSLYVIQNG
jgi:hypothetical protein